MGKFSKFMKENKIVKENTTYPATKSLVDEKGEPLLWTIKPLTSKENNVLVDKCMHDVPVPGKPNMYRPVLDNMKYQTKIICQCVLEPNLHDTELQDSYGVKTPEELIVEMIDNPIEYQNFVNFIQEFSGVKTINDEIEEAKN